MISQTPTMIHHFSLNQRRIWIKHGLTSKFWWRAQKTHKFVIFTIFLIHTEWNIIRIVLLINISLLNKIMSSQVAKTILEQLGGSRFCAIIWAKNIVWSSNSLQFSIWSWAKNGINKAVITLTQEDLYDMEFWKIRWIDAKLISKDKWVYSEDLQKFFTIATGFATKF